MFIVLKRQLQLSVFSFKTEESVDAESATVLVATSDMQKDNSNPNMFEKVVNDGIISLF